MASARTEEVLALDLSIASNVLLEMKAVARSPLGHPRARTGLHKQRLQDLRVPRRGRITHLTASELTATFYVPERDNNTLYSFIRSKSRQVDAASTRKCHLMQETVSMRPGVLTSISASAVSSRWTGPRGRSCAVSSLPSRS